MIDQDYVEELRGLEDKKEAKKKLLDYAKESFNLDVKKSKAFDSIIADIEEHIKRYNEEAGLDEPEEGAFSPTDFVEEANLESMTGDEVTLGLDVPNIEIGSPVGPIGDLPEGVESYVGKDHEDPVKLQEIVEHIKEVEKSEEPTDMYDIGDFNPTVILIGKGRGYVNCPWWIYEWISNNPDWKVKPKSFQHSSAHPTLLSFIYYIKRDGFVRIRETKNSSFHILE